MNETFYYSWIFKKPNPRGSVESTITYYYNEWTGQLKDRGEYYCEKFAFSNFKLTRAEYFRISNGGKNSDIYVFDWDADKLIKISELGYPNEYITHFHYNNDLLQCEERFYLKDNILTKTEELHYEYTSVINEQKLVKISKSIYDDNKVIQISTVKQFDYDKKGRIEKKYLAGNYDDLGRTIICYYDYSKDSEAVEVTKKYSDEIKPHGKYYIRNYKGEEFISNSIELAKEFKLNSKEDLERIIGHLFTYEYDDKNNWIKKYDHNRLIAERTIHYKE